jgi:hypothetical protein
MVRRNRWIFLSVSALPFVATVWSSMAGCRSDGTSSSANTGGAGGSGVSTSTSTSKSSSASSNSSSSNSSSGSASSSSSGGGVDTTITDITTGKVGPGVKVKLTGVVAMSQKFLVSKGGTGSCLWGVFVSEPNLAETKENTGTLVLSYGNMAAIPEGGSTSFCPRLGVTPPDAIGDLIPDDIGPGDVLDVAGETAKFILPNSCILPTDAKVGQYQVAKTTTIMRTKTGGPVPTPHVLTDPELVQLASPTDQAFHDKWGGVKVRIQNVTSVPQTVMGMPSLTNQYGEMFMAGSNLQVGDKLYYRGYLKATDFCHNSPIYPSPTTMFTSIDGFSYLDFCTWSLTPNNKCSDLSPPSPDAMDCNGNAMACP